MMRLNIIGALAWLILFAGYLRYRRDRGKDGPRQTYLLLGRAYITPALVGLAALMLPVGLLVYLFPGGEEVSDIVGWVGAIGLLVGFFLVQILAFELVTRLVCTRRLAIDDVGLRVESILGGRPRFALRWDRPYGHRVLLHERPRRSSRRADSTFRQELRQFVQDGEEIYLCLHPKGSYPERVRTAPAGPKLWVRDGLAFRDDPRIAAMTASAAGGPG